MLELDLHAHVHLNTLYAAVRTPGAQLPPPTPAFVPYFSLILAFSVAVSSLLAQAGSRLPMHLCVREVSVSDECADCVVVSHAFPVQQAGRLHSGVIACLSCSIYSYSCLVLNSCSYRVLYIGDLRQKQLAIGKTT